jgi:hypothetical protein
MFPLQPLQIVAFSGGQGAGKTTLGNALVNLMRPYMPAARYSLAAGIRVRAEQLLVNEGYKPAFATLVHSPNQADKELPIIGYRVPGVEGDASIRDLLIHIGQTAAHDDPLCWARDVWDTIRKDPRHLGGGASVAVVDDLRKVNELVYLTSRTYYPANVELLHVHVHGGKADYDHHILAEIAQIHVGREADRDQPLMSARERALIITDVLGMRVE